MKSLKIILILALSLFQLSCGMHTPMSEMVMFQEKKTLTNDSTYLAKYSHAIASFNSDQNLQSEVVKYAQKNSASNNDYSYGNGIGLTTNFIFMGKRAEGLALSAAVGAAGGIDITTKVFRHNYLTLGMGSGRTSSIEPHLQAIFQHRLLGGNPVGLSVGPIIRYNYRYASEVRESISFDEGIEFSTTSMGIRSVLILSPRARYGQSKPFFYFTGSYNYDLTLDTYYPKLGVALGLY